jgi:hypothetical protein
MAFSVLKMIPEAQERMVELRRQVGANDRSIIEALLLRGIEDTSPLTLRKLFPDKFDAGLLTDLVRPARQEIPVVIETQHFSVKITVAPTATLQDIMNDSRYRDLFSVIPAHCTLDRI